MTNIENGRLLAVLTVISSLAWCACATDGQYSVVVDGAVTVSPLNHFWESTGFCPPLPHQDFRTYALSDDEFQNLAHIGSVPRQGIAQVRIHWLLDLVKVTSIKGMSIEYDFNDLDALLDRLHMNGLRPGFELMGNPSNYYTSFDNKTQVYQWKDLVMQVASRYIQRYGTDCVLRWNFETWNEPSNGDFDTLNMTIDGFLNYYDACLEGLTAINPSLRLGGPGDGCRAGRNPYCWALLLHCSNGTNFFTGKTGVRIDYISFHHKGKGSSMVILNDTIDSIQTIHELYPQLSKVPIFNDEADPLGGWNKPEEWRADARYAAMVAKIIAQHQYTFLNTAAKAEASMYTLLSNDNGFMNFGPPNFFNQRTLTARFMMNLTKPRSVEVIRKPVLTVMGLLALLGDQQLATVVLQNGVPTDVDSHVGALAGVHNPTGPGDSWEAAVLIYNSDDTSNATSAGALVTLALKDVQPQNVSQPSAIAVYKLDDAHGNPYKVWLDAGKPVYPNQPLLESMRSQQDSVRSSLAVGHDLSPEVLFGFVNISTFVPLPGVTVFHLCQKGEAPPQVQNVRLRNVTSGEVLVMWTSVTTRCLATYHVLFSASGREGKYSLANPSSQLIFSAFVHILDVKQREMSETNSTIFYKIMAEDYFGQIGVQSEPVSISF